MYEFLNRMKMIGTCKYRTLFADNLVDWLVKNAKSFKKQTIPTFLAKTWKTLSHFLHTAGIALLIPFF